jgi:hypothetical protein
MKEAEGSRPQHAQEVVAACTSCTSVQEGGGEWQSVAEFLRRRFGLTVHAGVCPACLARFYPDLAKPSAPED